MGTAMITERPDVMLQSAVKDLSRFRSPVACREFDGKHLPLASKSVEVVVLWDILHDVDDPEFLLREARRVARNSVVVKDVIVRGAAPSSGRVFLDWLSDQMNGDTYRRDYLASNEWDEMFERAKMAVISSDLHGGSGWIRRGLTIGSEDFVACLDASMATYSGNEARRAFAMNGERPIQSDLPFGFNLRRPSRVAHRYRTGFSVAA
jgi:SAM-dependent methyltransferase